MELEVTETTVPDDRHARIENPAPDLDNWDATYICFSGYFGSYSPHVFKAAPDLYEALDNAMYELASNGYRDDDGPMPVILAALAKARGEK